MKKNKLYFFAVLALLFQVPVLSASAQETIAYMKIESAGKIIAGSSTMNDTKDQIECIGYMYTATTPHDAAGGMATGKRTAGTIVIMKHLDAASTELMDASADNQVLQTVTISFYKKTGTTVEAYQQIKLTNAVISQFSQYEGTLGPDKSASASSMVEEITLSAQKIEFVSTASNAAAATKGTVKTGYDIKANKKQ